MKKILLFAMLFSFSLASMAQYETVNIKNLKKSKDIEVSQKNNLPAPVINADKAVAEDINRIYVGKAKDFRTVRKEDTRAISYNPELDIISIVYVLDPATYGTNGTDMGMVYSTDRGATWSEPLVIFDNGNSYTNDYPSGIVFNPDGNTAVEDAYGVMQNISHVGGDWGYKMWGSMTLGGENHAIEISHNPDNIEDGYWNQYGLTQIEDQVRCLNMLPQGDWGNYQSAELQPIFGDFEGTDFLWDESMLIEMDLSQSSEDGQMAWIGSYQAHDGGIDMAWSEDGQIGYMYMVGATNDFPSGYQPIVYRTEDAGDNWDLIELDFTTDEMQALLEPFIIENWKGDMIPSVFESASVVDMHGDLQIFAATGSHSADIYNYPDSLGWGWTYPGDLMNLVVNDNGLTDIIWIDSLFTSNLGDDDEGNYAGNGWNHRLSAARNENGSQIFLTWTDTRDVANELNVEPDVFGWTRDLVYYESIDPICLTEGTLYEKFYYFTYGSEIAYLNEEGSYTIPYMQCVTPGEFASNGGTDPITVNYITGINLVNLIVDGVSDMQNQASFKISQNQPNPFTGSTIIEITTQTVSPASIEVTSLLGQTVYSMNAGIINGSQNVEINAENLESGVYFYTVTIGNESITKKMIIE
ncbi:MULTISPECIES: T9SS type A sorting domain-containing protein [unclassified Lentimicrobium]|uniref:T9SS type A sorting domain-containing protein n=1 Tax=unclassified Lentimicrobium TaxID=2677434 RepID=UPI001553673A|nr:MULTISPECIES: T9SS type A sorting domain-containing protein [unclassified Lentimicrobium]NPD46037.1 T9SS type A sorting domain-containing protein [Lentimicrobium sp. S6]NPD85237.1 T9SS type A sorting domain-containing protein [Lentimicrobium sp. L6]